MKTSRKLIVLPLLALTLLAYVIYELSLKESIKTTPETVYQYDKTKSWLHDEITVTLHDKNRFQNFLERHYENLRELRLANLKDLNYYKNEFFTFSEKNFNSSIKFLRTQQESFRRVKPIESRMKFTDFYRVERGKPRTIYYFPMPHVSTLYGVKPALQMLEEFPEYNLVLIDGFRFFTTEKPLSASMAKKHFTEELLDYISEHPGEDAYFSVVCFGYLLAENFLSNHRDKYKGLILYAPMVKERVERHQISPDLIFDKSQAYMAYEDLLSLVYIVSDSPMAIAMPDYNRYFNKMTFANLFAEYRKGAAHHRYENAMILISQHDQIVPHDNSKFEDPIPVEIIKNADHLSPLFVPAHLKEYMEYSKQILK